MVGHSSVSWCDLQLACGNLSSLQWVSVWPKVYGQVYELERNLQVEARPEEQKRRKTVSITLALKVNVKHVL